MRILLGEQEGQLTIPGSAEIAHTLLDELLPDADVAQRLQELVAIEEENAAIVESSKYTDDERGEALILGLSCLMRISVTMMRRLFRVARARQRAASTAARVAAVINRQ